MIYLDNGATTFPKPECVYAAMDTFARTGAVNAGRGAYKAAREAGAMIAETRDMLISLLDAKEQADIILSSSVTIALNQIICGYRWTSQSIAYISPYEHNAILRPLELMRKKTGFKVIELPLKDDLSIDLEATEDMFKTNAPTFVAITAVSNVTGYILPATQVFRMAKQYKAFTLLDGAQAVGLVKMRFSQLKADAVSFAGHKTLYGPFGTGGVYLKRGVDLDIVLSGGTGVESLSIEMPRRMPGKMEFASKDVVSIYGLHTALKWLHTVDSRKHECDLTEYLLEHLREISGINIYSAPSMDCQAGIISINIDGFLSSEIAAVLDNTFDIAVRAGHHCAANIHRHLNDKKFKGTVRISIGYFNTKSDIDALIDALKVLDHTMLDNIYDLILRGGC